MVQGIGTTAFESLSVAAIGDMFFLHERGLRTALLVLTLACLSSFVAIIAGTGFEHLGARNLFVILLPIQIFGMLGVLFFMPESQFNRSVISAPAPVSSSEAVRAKEKASNTHIDETAPNHANGTSSSLSKRSFVQNLRPATGETYNEQSMPKLLLEIFVHLFNPAVIWVMLVSAVLVVRLSPS
jgi:MFS family permease